MGVIAASSRGVPFADSPWINSASSTSFELVIASQVILYRLTALTMHRGWESRSKGSCHMDLSMQISNNTALRVTLSHSSTCISSSEPVSSIIWRVKWFQTQSRLRHKDHYKYIFLIIQIIKCYWQCTRPPHEQREYKVSVSNFKYSVPVDEPVFPGFRAFQSTLCCVYNSSSPRKFKRIHTWSLTERVCT